MPRAFLHVGGASVAHHQLTLAISLGCERIVCLAREMSPALVELQHAAERGATQFHVISSPRQLGALITGVDELVVIADGVLAAPARVAEVMGGGPVVLVQPVDSGVEAGFERLNLNQASAGVIRIPGHLAERLTELPADCDVASALTRIALQAGIAQQAVPAEFREGAGWRMVRTEDEAQSLESGWIQLHLGPGIEPAPGPALARMAVLRMGATLLHAGKGARAVATVSGALLLLALIAGWFGHTLIGMALCSAGWLLRRAAMLLERVESDSLKQSGPRLPGIELFGWVCDAAVVLLVVWSFPAIDWKNWLGLSFGPLILLLLLRMLAATSDDRWAALCADRFTLILVLGLLSLSGLLMPGIKVFAIAIAVAALNFSRLSARLTRA